MGRRSASCFRLTERVERAMSLRNKLLATYVVFVASAGRPRSVERVAARGGRRRIRANTLRKLRVGRRGAEHEGKPGAPGFRCAVRPARPNGASAASARGASPPVRRRLRPSGRQHHRARRGSHHCGDSERPRRVLSSVGGSARIILAGSNRSSTACGARSIACCSSIRKRC